MQATHRRNRNCRKVSINVTPSEQCTQKQQRIRCCGRVLTEEELSNTLLEGVEEQVFHAGQGRGKGQGQGRRSQNAQAPQEQNPQGQRQGKGRGRFQGRGKGQQTL